MSLPADSSCEGRVSLHFTQSGLLIPMAAGVVVERGSEYILAHTGPRELDGHPLGGCGSGFSSRLYYPFGKGSDQHIIRCLKNKKCENERSFGPVDGETSLPHQSHLNAGRLGTKRSSDLKEMIWVPTAKQEFLLRRGPGIVSRTGRRERDGHLKGPGPNRTQK